MIAYIPIAFDERVTFWLHRAQSLPCACAFTVLYVCVIAQWLYASLRTKIMQHAHVHKAVTGRVEAKKLFSHRRQSNYRCFVLFCFFRYTFNRIQGCFKKKIHWNHVNTNSVNTKWFDVPMHWLWMLQTPYNTKSWQKKPMWPHRFHVKEVPLYIFDI